MGGSAHDAEAATRRILFGTDEPLPAPVPLRAGPLALTLRGGALHGLSWDGHPVWHAVTFPHRDADWWTPPFAAEPAVVGEAEGGFRAELRGAFATAPALRTRFLAAARADGRLRVEAEAAPDGDLATNRTGLCLLLPTAAGGDPIEVEHDDGRITSSTVPVLVAPWPPFTAIRALRWRFAPDLWACCAFEGDSFEFEDQRNNADLSFKVYNRSNMMPRPYRLRAGAPVRQALELWVERASPLPLQGEGGARLPLQGKEDRVGSGAVATRLPRFGLAVPLDADRDLLRRVVDALRPAYLHASLDADALATADLAALADAGAPLRLELTLGERLPSDADLDVLRRARPDAVALFPSPPDAVAALRRALPNVQVGGGTPHFFAQINRIEGLGPVDHLSFTVSPLVHGAEDEEVMACPGAIPGLAATLRHRWPGLPIHLGPSAIAMRASPLGRMPICDGRSRRALAGDDPRARGLYAAAWALAFAAACADGRIAAATLMAAQGPSGVAARDGGRLVWHPVAAVLARLAGPAEVVPSPVAPSAGLAALALRRAGARELLLANLSAEPAEVALDGWAAGAAPAVLDAEALRAASPAGGLPRFMPRPAAGRLVLGPYAVACLAEDPSPKEVIE